MASDEAPPRAHGGVDVDELRSAGVAPASVLDLSVNVNPYGPSDFMRAAIRNAAIDCYPDARASAARAALARLWDVDEDGVVLGAGAAQLLWDIARATVRAGEHVIVVEPTFSELGAAARALGAVVHEVTATEEESFRHDPGRLARAVHERRARLVYVCAPNNPTGVAWDIYEIAAVIRRCPDALFVVDQSFLSLSDRYGDAAVALPDNAVRVRSLTKDHAIPGARVGVAIGTPALAAAVERQRPAWSTGAATQAAAVAAAAATEQDFVAASRRRLLDDRSALMERLRALGLSPVPSSTVFILLPMKDARTVRMKLLQSHGILVRDCSSFGLPNHVRLAVRPPADQARFLHALEDRSLTVAPL